MTAPHPQTESEYLTAAQVKSRYGDASDMWITRRLRDDDFPAPVYFGTPNRFWRRADLIAWDAMMIERGLKESKRTPPPSRKLADARRNATEEGLIADRQFKR